MNFKKSLFEYKKQIFATLFFVFIFILFSYLFQVYEEEIKNIIEPNIYGMLLYISIGIFATVVAPVSSLPILPLAVVFWGWKFAGILTLISWTIGSLIAFYLARRFGRKLVLKIVNEKSLKKYENMVPEKNLFLTIVFLRIILPADLISYVLGLLSRISYKLYVSATIIGLAPFIFIFSYMGSLSIIEQVFIFGSICIFLLIIYFIFFRFKDKIQKKSDLNRNSKKNFKNDIYINNNVNIKIKDEKK